MEKTKTKTRNRPGKYTAKEEGKEETKSKKWHVWRECYEKRRHTFPFGGRNTEERDDQKPEEKRTSWLISPWNRRRSREVWEDMEVGGMS